MSVAAMTWASNISTDPSAKVVLLGLAWAADPSALCSLTLAQLQAWTCLSKRAVQRALDRLEQEDLVEVHRDIGRPATYQLPSAAREAESDPCTSDTGAGVDPCTSDTGAGVDPCTSDTGAGVDPCTSDTGAGVDPPPVPPPPFPTPHPSSPLTPQESGREPAADAAAAPSLDPPAALTIEDLPGATPSAHGDARRAIDAWLSLSGALTANPTITRVLRTDVADCGLRRVLAAIDDIASEGRRHPNVRWVRDRIEGRRPQARSAPQTEESRNCSEWERRELLRREVEVRTGRAIVGEGSFDE